MQQETARQKRNAMQLGPEFVLKVDMDMAEILEGIPLIHSWIRNQALFKTVNIQEDAEDEDIVIRLTSTDPHKCKNIVRFNHVTGVFEKVKLR